MNVSITQAMACGLPVIATRHSGFPEQVLHGTTGILVAEGDWAALGAAILDLATHPERCSEMGAAGRLHAQERYDSGQLLDRQVRLYCDLLPVEPRLK